MGTVTDNPEDCGGAWLSIGELATFLGRHGWGDEGTGQGGRVVCLLVREGTWKGENGHHSLYLSETKADASPVSSNLHPFMSRVTWSLIHFVIPYIIQRLSVSSIHLSLKSFRAVAHSLFDDIDLTQPSLAVRGVELIISFGSWRLSLAWGSVVIESDLSIRRWGEVAFLPAERHDSRNTPNDG